MRRVDVAILGGGIAGLVVAHELTAAGLSVEVLERQPHVGGLARTVRHGDYRFDQGGHRFHSDDPAILDWMDELMGDRVIHVVRKSRIHIRGRWVRYPLAPLEAATAFGAAEATAMGLSYLRASMSRNGKPEPSFDRWVIARFGRRLYDVYFRPYTEKVWGIPSHRISASWAAERISTGNLLKTIVQSVRGGPKTAKSLVSRFRYFPTGIGELSQALARGLETGGRGRLRLSTSVTGLERAKGAWAVAIEGPDGRESLRAERVVSTVPITLLPRLLPAGSERDTAVAAAKQLAYRGVVCVAAGVRRPSLTDDTWIYFPERSVTFGRLHEPRNWSRLMAPEGRTSFCLEIFASPGDSTWRAPDAEIAGRCARDLERLGLLRTSEVEPARVVRVPGAYPLWHVGFEEPLARLRGALAALGGIHPVGRTGNFEYLNIDGVVARAWELVDRLLGRSEIRSAPDRMVVS